MATQTTLDALSARVINDITREIMRTGIDLTYDEADELGEEAIDWMGSSLGLRCESTDEGLVFSPQEETVYDADESDEYTIVTDSGKVTIAAVDADAAAREYARREEMRGVKTADDLRAYVERKGGYGHMEDSSGAWMWSVAQ